jgi:hypothetical protein
VKHENVSKELVMATQSNLSRFPKGTTSAVFSMALSFLCVGPLEHVSRHLGGLLCGLAGALLKYVPSILVEAGQGVAGYGLDHVQILSCLESLVSICSFLRLLVNVISN